MKKKTKPNRFPSSSPVFFFSNNNKKRSSSTMRNIAACYSDHAVKVSDSYCAAAYPNRSYVSRALAPPARNVVVSTYKVKLSSQKHLLITFAWSTKLLRRGFWIRVTRKSTSGQPNSALRVPAEKGRERFRACGSTVELYWDLSNASFVGPGPDPVGSFYVVVLVDSVVALVLGDMEEDGSVRELTSGLQAAKSSLASQCEHVSGSTQFSTRARFSDTGGDHEVVIRCGAEVDEVGPVLAVLIDRKTVVRVRRLKWNFRGNQVVFVEGLLVDVMWDVSRWMAEGDYDGRSTVRDGGYDGVFMFRTRSGLDSRLWFEEERLAHQNHDKLEFSFVICATKKLG